MNRRLNGTQQNRHALAARARFFTSLALLLLGGIPLFLAGCATTTQANAVPTARPHQMSRLTPTSKTPVDLTQTQHGLHVTLKVDPNAYGPNNFGVILLNSATDQPIEGASVQLLSTMLDMDMGTIRFDLPPQGQGFYLGQNDLPMGGHWQVVVQVRVPSDPNTHYSVTFLFTAAIWVGAN